MGPARSTVDHIQEAGRAGRNGVSSHNIVIFYGNLLTHCEKAVKLFCKTKECIRKALFKDFATVESVQPLHSCCSNCEHLCECSGEKCLREKYPFDTPLGNTKNQFVPGCERHVTEDDRLDLKEALLEVKGNLSSQSLAAFGPSSSHGFSEELIDSVVEDSSTVFTISDILSRFPVFNVFHAKLILEVFSEIFEDIVDMEESATAIPNDMYYNLPFLDNEDNFLGCCSDSDSDPDVVNTDEIEDI